MFRGDEINATNTGSLFLHRWPFSLILSTVQKNFYLPEIKGLLISLYLVTIYTYVYSAMLHQHVASEKKKCNLVIMTLYWRQAARSQTVTEEPHDVLLLTHVWDY